MKTKISYSLVFLFVLGAFILLAVAAHFKYADPDGYYHLKMASLIVQGKIHQTFPWLQYTTWKNGFADQHYLFHLLLVPFVFAKVLWLVVPFFSALMFTVFYWLLNKLGIKVKLFWLIIALAGSADFLFRINLIKANTLSLIMLFAGLAILYSKRYFWLLPLSAIFVWTYGGFVFLPVIVGAYCLTESVARHSIVWKPLLWSLLGIAVGILLHPQAAHLIPYLQAQIFQTGLGSGGAVPVGVEWDAYNKEYFIKTNFLVMGLWFASVAVLIRRHGKFTNAYEWFLFLVSLGFWVLTLLHRRFIEYGVPFSIIFSAYILSPYLRKIQWKNIQAVWEQHWQFRISILIGFIILSFSFYSNTLQTLSYFRASAPKNSYQGAANWLNNHSSHESIVFNTQWDQFPELFYLADKNYYIVGMDPTFMYLYEPNLYWKWRQITDDQPSEWESNAQVYNIIKSDFKASYVFVENNRNPNLLKLLQSDPAFVSVYQDNRDTLFAVH